jgi:hypothetical protein
MGTGAQIGKDMTGAMTAATGGVLRNEDAQNTAPGGFDLHNTQGSGLAALATGYAAGNAMAASETWDCACGTKGIRSKFCPECGSKKPEQEQGWNCAVCGNKGILSKFCPECGSKKP